jgi:hypothetical protein
VNSAITLTKRERLHKLGIRPFPVLIHDQTKEWLVDHFKKGASDYPVNVALLMRNIIWQLRDRIRSGDKPPLKELVRTFWYMYIKPTLARADSLVHETDQYDQLVDTLVRLVKDTAVMDYKDIGFRDDNQANRKVGLNANVILFSEKVGHQDFLAEISQQYQISTIALGGQPSVMNIEYFVDDIKAHGVDVRRSFYLFSIVDYDASGHIIRNSFIDDLRRYGIKNIHVTDLINPDMLTPEEIQLARYPSPDTKAMAKKNTAWHKAIRAMKYQNQKYLGPDSDSRGNRIIWGLESESISSTRLAAKLAQLLPGLLGQSERLLVIHRLEELNLALKNLMIQKLT